MCPHTKGQERRIVSVLQGLRCGEDQKDREHVAIEGGVPGELSGRCWGPRSGRAEEAAVVGMVTAPAGKRRFPCWA